MSKHHIEKVTCPSCHHEGDFEVWDSINTVLDPAMKEKVLNQSIFLYTCPIEPRSSVGIRSFPTDAWFRTRAWIISDSAAL